MAMQGDGWIKSALKNILNSLVGDIFKIPMSTSWVSLRSSLRLSS